MCKPIKITNKVNKVEQNSHNFLATLLGGSSSSFKDNGCDDWSTTGLWDDNSWSGSNILLKMRSFALKKTVWHPLLWRAWTKTFDTNHTNYMSFLVMQLKYTSSSTIHIPCASNLILLLNDIYIYMEKQRYAKFLWLKENQTHKY